MVKNKFNAFNKPKPEDFLSRKEELKELLRIPKDEEMQMEVECGASWQVLSNGAFTRLKCRKCGVIIKDGGTPKCLLNK